MEKITILRAGPLTTVQDLGRTAQRKAGVSPGGALDSHAARVANLLVGNPETDALLEIAPGQARIRFHDERVIAWCGGEFQLRIAATDLPPGRAAFVRPHEELEIDPPKRGCRAWIAFSGGIDVPLLLGSRATDLRGGFGGLEGRALRDGDELPLGIASQGRQSSGRIASWGAPAEWACTARQNPTLRVTRGVEWADFTTAAQTAFFREAFNVSTKVDRMGARLEGPELRRMSDTELLSAAVAPGAIQVPNDGQPIVLLGDCQTIGGYPKIAHVITVDLSIAAQLRPNESVRFHEVSLAQAREFFVTRENDLERFRLGLRLRVS
jgi:antagonist of KipI